MALGTTWGLLSGTDAPAEPLCIQKVGAKAHLEDAQGHICADKIARAQNHAPRAPTGRNPQMRPSASIASATRVKPAMFAPAT